MSLERFINRNRQGYWVHVVGTPPDADKPFHLRYGPYRWGIAALYQFWVVTAGTGDEPQFGCPP